MTDTITLNDIDPAGGHVEQQVNQGIRQQINFIDIHHPAVGFGEEPLMKSGLLLG